MKWSSQIPVLPYSAFKYEVLLSFWLIFPNHSSIVFEVTLQSGPESKLFGFALCRFARRTKAIAFAFLFLQLLGMFSSSLRLPPHHLTDAVLVIFCWVPHSKSWIIACHSFTQGAYRRLSSRAPSARARACNLIFDLSVINSFNILAFRFIFLLLFDIVFNFQCAYAV